MYALLLSGLHLESSLIIEKKTCNCNRELSHVSDSLCKTMTSTGTNSLYCFISSKRHRGPLLPGRAAKLMSRADIDFRRKHRRNPNAIVLGVAAFFVIVMTGKEIFEEGSEKEEIFLPRSICTLLFSLNDLSTTFKVCDKTFDVSFT